MDQQLDQQLEEARRARAAGVERSELWKKIHDLAEASYEPAVEFFRSFLDDPDWDWRLEGLQLLGFHYRFAPDAEIIAKMKQLLLTDPSDAVRSSAATALGSQLGRMEPRPAWPDPTLLRAMRHDPDGDVRSAAFESLLRAAGLLFPVVKAEVEQVEKGRKRPTLAEVKRILRDRGIDPAAVS